MQKLTTCEKCEHRKSENMGFLSIEGCGLTGLVIPHAAATGQDTIFYRVPLECPRPDSEVIKQEAK